MITVTEKAKHRLIDLRTESNYDEQYFLRVSVKSGGCSGLSYDLNFDKELKAGDQEFNPEGVKVVVDMRSMLYLFGSELDFSDGLNGKGFAFSNPNASRTCSCGESFSV
ncbi:MAG: iron-sulfur cluster assembly accessory protein [Bacteroidia bacterium]|nr:iron-sulfur cluster assembly accessory protein [Bacteroidia bacterium]